MFGNDKGEIRTEMDYGFTEPIPGKRLEKDSSGRLLVVERLVRADEIGPYLGLLNEIWGFTEKEEIPLHEAVVIAKTGGLIGGLDINGAPAGIVFVMPAFNREWGFHHHSNFMGFKPEFRSGGLGLEIKRAHALWAHREGVGLVTWTFDPLQAANANLNFRKLGAVCRNYIADLYGRMGGSFDPGLPTDRLLLEWRIGTERVQARLGGSIPSRSELEADHAGDTILTIEDEIGRPIDGPLLVRIPEGVHEQAASDLQNAEARLYKFRRLLSGLFDQGFVITGMVPASDSGGRNYYILEKGEFA